MLSDAGRGAQGNIRPRTHQTRRTNTRNIKPTYSNAICNTTADFFFHESISCSGREWHSAVQCRAEHKAGKYRLFPEFGRVFLSFGEHNVVWYFHSHSE